MLSKKMMFFLLACFSGSSYSAALGYADIHYIKEPAIWRQNLDERTAMQRIIVVLQGADQILEDHLRLLGEENLYALIKRKRTERLLVVSFWEQLPQKLKEDTNRIAFSTQDLQAFYYPQRSRLVIFLSRSAYGVAREGVAAINGDHSMYKGFSFLIEQTIRYISNKQEIIPTEVICVGTAPHIVTLKNYLEGRVLCFCLEPLADGKPSPVREFTSSLDLLEGSPRPIARRALSFDTRFPDDRGGDACLGGLRRRLALFRLQEAGLPLRAFPGIKTSTEG